MRGARRAEGRAGGEGAGRAAARRGATCGGRGAAWGGEGGAAAAPGSAVGGVGRRSHQQEVADGLVPAVALDPLGPLGEADLPEEKAVLGEGRGAWGGGRGGCGGCGGRRGWPRVRRVQGAPRVAEGAEGAGAPEARAGRTSSRSSQVRRPRSRRRLATRLIGMGRHCIHTSLFSSDCARGGRGRGCGCRACAGQAPRVGGGGTHRVDERDVGDRLVLRHLRPLLGVDLHGEGGACGVSGGACARSAGRPAQARPRTSSRVVPCTAGCSSVTGIRLALRRARVRHS